MSTPEGRERATSTVAAAAGGRSRVGEQVTPTAQIRLGVFRDDDLNRFILNRWTMNHTLRFDFIDGPLHRVAYIAAGLHQLADTLTAVSTAIVVPKLNTWTIITVEPCIQPSTCVVITTSAFTTAVVAVSVQFTSPITPQV